MYFIGKIYDIKLFKLKDLKKYTLIFFKKKKK